MDVNKAFMDEIELDTFYKKALRVHRRRLRAAERGHWLPVAELNKVVSGE